MLPSILKERKAKGLQAACAGLQPFLISMSILSSGDRNSAKFGKNYSPMDIGVLWFLGV